MQAKEPAPAKVNLALHVRGELPDGRHRLETVFAFCTDGDLVAGDPADDLTLQVKGPFAAELGAVEDNLVMRAAKALQGQAGVSQGAALTRARRLR
jgi:4-diphosphocytidyl-2-C-methyl-D-erythritol kinase